MALPLLLLESIVGHFVSNTQCFGHPPLVRNVFPSSFTPLFSDLDVSHRIANPQAPGSATVLPMTLFRSVLSLHKISERGVFQTLGSSRATALFISPFWVEFGLPGAHGGSQVFNLGFSCDTPFPN